MTFKFRDLIDKPSRERHDKVAREIDRLYRLPDRFLARSLVKIARDSRATAPGLMGNAFDCGYDGLLAWGVVTHIARHLGETDFTENELAAARSIDPDPVAVRRLAGNCLNNNSISRWGERLGSFDLALLGNEFVNGNPVTIGLDRVHPPEPTSRDWIAVHMREVSRARFGTEAHDTWSPQFQNHGRDGKLFPERDAPPLRDPESDRLIDFDDGPSF